MTERSASPSNQIVIMAAVTAIALPGVILRLTSTHVSSALAAVIFGLAVVSAAFMLAWAAEAIQLDISAGLALAVLALIAVLPEYAVDFVFTNKAGNTYAKYNACVAPNAPKDFTNNCHLALANMTGGNQLLVGVGWSMVVLLAVGRAKTLKRKGVDLSAEHDVDEHQVNLERSHAIDISFLILAAVYGLTLPLRSSLSLIDAVVLVSIFVAYLIRIAGSPAEEPHLVGPALLIGNLAQRKRRITVAIMFLVAAGIILLVAEHFAEALVDTGTEFGISEFLLVKWLAPLASEAPELLVAGLFAWRLNANSALGALISSKVNQWTLLVGTLPIVFAISSKSLHGLPLDSLQRSELFVTAAQSVFAVAIVADRSMSKREAQGLLSIFIVQFVMQGVLKGDVEEISRVVVGVLYLVGAAVIIARKRAYVRPLLTDGLRVPHDQLHA